MLLQAQTLDLHPYAGELFASLTDRVGFKLELPASQLEIVGPACESVEALASRLYDGRQRLAAQLPHHVCLAAAGAHPFAAAEGPLNGGPRYERIEQEYGFAVRRQLICGLHVHVAIAGADRALAVYNALRGHLPELAALGANAPLHLGRDTGMASVRPGIASALPRQGIPPSFSSWEELAAALAWSTRGGRLSNLREWWWELRLHPLLGTLEIRVPDAQSAIADVAALIAAAAALVLWLAQRHDAGELPPAPPSWRIAENRWSAARHGVHGRMVDLETGAQVFTSERLGALLDALAPFASDLGAERHLCQARRLVEANGADRQRSVAAEQGPQGLVNFLSESFLTPLA